MRRAMRFAVATVVLVTLPVWILPAMFLHAFYHGVKSTEKLLFGSKQR